MLSGFVPASRLAPASTVSGRFFYYFYSAIVLLLLIFTTIARLMKQEHIVINDNSVYSAGILMRKEQIAVIALAAWLTVILIFMLLAQTFDIGIFFVLSIIGFLITLKLITPKYIRPGYIRYIRYILAAGIVIFGVIVALKVMEILGLEIGFL